MLFIPLQHSTFTDHCSTARVCPHDIPYTTHSRTSQDVYGKPLRRILKSTITTTCHIGSPAPRISISTKLTLSRCINSSRKNPFHPSIRIFSWFPSHRTPATRLCKLWPMDHQRLDSIRPRTTRKACLRLNSVWILTFLAANTFEHSGLRCPCWSHHEHCLCLGSSIIFI